MTVVMVMTMVMAIPPHKIPGFPSPEYPILLLLDLPSCPRPPVPSPNFPSPEDPILLDLPRDVPRLPPVAYIVPRSPVARSFDWARKQNHGRKEGRTEGRKKRAMGVPCSRSPFHAIAATR